MGVLIFYIAQPQMQMNIDEEEEEDGGQNEEEEEEKLGDHLILVSLALIN